MDRQAIERIVADVMAQLGQGSVPAPADGTIPVAVSARHVHLSPEHVEALFGKGYELTKRSELSQPGQFASNEMVVIAGPKGSLERVRVLGPVRQLTQAEISWTDAMKIGVRPPLRESGNVKDSAPVTMIGPSGSVSLPEGLIIAQAHIHMAPHDARQFGVKDGERVSVKISSERPLSIDHVRIRVSERYRLEMHIDTDEANAGFIRSGARGLILSDHTAVPSAAPVVQQTVLPYEFKQKLLAREHIQAIDETEIVVRKGTIVTPLAKDTARELGKEITFIK
ncbi:phosphate propanoyltransferase [Domibacillus enclensis]|uniref:Phosphate propanoyltransferase n=1 Tax=Domibacillus enclensis TaxID=1017273 RepID=A0A1N6ZGF3_9BACI|nr:phosphate propanoyltransferase [Domibacillus enclensis]OXS76695.1 acetate kinase [Domibacillus enclensis]SIR25841.1 putative phosphotransacetylase [Domibacillus enclensis]